MSTQLTFKRPGGVQIEVSTYDGRFLDLRVSQRGRGSRVSKGIVSAYAPLKRQQFGSCHIHQNSDGEWCLFVGYAIARLSEDEARQVADRFQIEIRHTAPIATAPTEAQPCHP